MEVLKVMSLTVAVSLAFATVITLAVSLALDPLERARQRWVAREREAGKIVHA
ncbi:MAG: hypothetical protein ACLPOO_02180 [Terriglobales bacterium]|jgi:hypothetical protein